MNRLLFTTLLFAAAPAAAAPIPDPIREMLEQAQESELSAVAKVAKRVAPGSAEEVEAYVAERKAARQAAERERLASRGFFEGWKGEGALGGSYSTGNTNEIGFSAALDLRRRGLQWEHEIDLSFDYLETDDVTQRERYYAAYIGRRDLGDDWFFAFGLLSYERDLFAGIESRFTESLGLGYRLADTEDFSWTVEGGPALRQTEFSNGTSENNINLLGRTDLDWQITERLRFTEAAGFTFGGGNTSLYSRTAFTAELLEALSARLSFDVQHETDPPADEANTSTISRVSLVYEF